MTKNTGSQPTASWLNLFLASKEASVREIPVSERPPGRPRKSAVTEKTTIYLSESDLQLIESWKVLISKIYGKKVYRSEVIQIIFRVIEDRLDAIGGSEGYTDIESLYSALVNAPALSAEKAVKEEPKRKPRKSTAKADATQE